MRVRISLMAWCVFSMCLAPRPTPGAIGEIAVTTASGDQQAPAVWGSTVVWEDKRSGAWDIAYADLSALPAIASGAVQLAGEDRGASISGNHIVWQNKRTGAQDWDIWGADITNRTSPSLFQVDWGTLDQQRPRIWETFVVYDYLWEGNRVLAFADITDPTRFSYDFWGYLDTDLQGPVIWGDKVICEYKYKGTGPFGNGTWDLYAFDFRDPNQNGYVTNWSPNDQQRPALYGHVAVWQDDTRGVWDVSADTITDPFWPKPVNPSGAGQAQSPSIWNNVVVWQDSRNGNWDIYGYNLTTQKEFRITLSTKDQTNPVISFSEELHQYIVVWQDNRNGNWDIYAALLEGANVAGCASPAQWDVNADAVVDEQDTLEVQSHLGERNGISP